MSGGVFGARHIHNYEVLHAVLVEHGWTENLSRADLIKHLLRLATTISDHQADKALALSLMDDHMSSHKPQPQRRGGQVMPGKHYCSDCLEDWPCTVEELKRILGKEPLNP